MKKLRNTPIYVKPQMSSESGTCRLSVMVGIRNDPGKVVDSVSVQFQLPHCVSSANLTANHGTVNILADKVPLSCYFNLYAHTLKRTYGCMTVCIRIFVL